MESPLDLNKSSTLNNSLIGVASKISRDSGDIDSDLRNIFRQVGVEVVCTGIVKFTRNFSIVLSGNPDEVSTGLWKKNTLTTYQKHFIDYMADKDTIHFQLGKKRTTIYFILVPKMKLYSKEHHSVSFNSFKKYSKSEDLFSVGENFNMLYTQLLEYVRSVTNQRGILTTDIKRNKRYYEFSLKNEFVRCNDETESRVSTDYEYNLIRSESFEFDSKPSLKPKSFLYKRFLEESFEEKHTERVTSKKPKLLYRKDETSNDETINDEASNGSEYFASSTINQDDSSISIHVEQQSVATQTDALVNTFDLSEEIFELSKGENFSVENIAEIIARSLH